MKRIRCMKIRHVLIADFFLKEHIVVFETQVFPIFLTWYLKIILAIFRIHISISSYCRNQVLIGGKNILKKLAAAHLQKLYFFTNFMGPNCKSELNRTLPQRSKNVVGNLKFKQFWRRQFFVDPNVSLKNLAVCMWLNLSRSQYDPLLFIQYFS